MKEQLRRGRLKLISFILLDLIALVIANVIAVGIYSDIGELSFGYNDYIVVVVYMMVIDIIVTIIFNTLNRVLRRITKTEIVECLKHVIICMVILTLLLFSMKRGAEFSRLTIYIAYVVYYVLIVLLHIGWKRLLSVNRSGKGIPTALLVTTDGYANEGLVTAENAGLAVRAVFVTDKTNEGIVRNIPTIVDRQDATAFLCWEWIDKVYVCGPENIDVPESLITACQQMKIPVYIAPARKSFDYDIVKIRTALSKDDKETGLSFFEGEHDIPFNIKRLYTIFEAEQEKQRGFYQYKQSWHLLFCPFGSIDVMVDTGRERRTISLSDPSAGLILHPSVWREMVWKKPGSVLCVAASGHYDADKLHSNYNEYLKFLQEKEWSATIESAEILGEVSI